MKNYRNSDYAINKYSNGIVYKFADTVIEITLEDYLRANPDKTEKEFLELKALSDEIYLEIDRAENAQTKKNVSIYGLEETSSCATSSLEEEYWESEELLHLRKAVDKLFREGKLTKNQKKRFILHFFRGMSIRKIAELEGVFFTSVAESLKCAEHKL